MRFHQTRKVKKLQCFQFFIFATVETCFVPHRKVLTTAEYS